MKKNLLLLTLLFFIPYLIQAQVGIGTENPHVSAALEIESNNKGLLISRMTSVQREAIQNPATALLIFQTDGDVGFYYYEGNSWILLKNISQMNADWNATDGWAEILNKPQISKAGLSGEFNDLNNIPEIVFTSDTSKMLMPYLTLSKIQPTLDLKTDRSTFEAEIIKTNQVVAINSDNITLNKGEIDALKIVTDENKSDILANTSEIQTNASNIQTNTANISQNTTDISTLETSVSENILDIKTNSDNITLSKGEIDALKIVTDENK
ncbi:hypothetical protein ACFSKL_12000, partial [Belliella marina]